MPENQNETPELRQWFGVFLLDELCHHSDERALLFRSVHESRELAVEQIREYLLEPAFFGNTYCVVELYDRRPRG